MSGRPPYPVEGAQREKVTRTGLWDSWVISGFLRVKTAPA
jgi:hypothetical protein